MTVHGAMQCVSFAVCKSYFLLYLRLAVQKLQWNKNLIVYLFGICPMPCSKIIVIATISSSSGGISVGRPEDKFSLRCRFGPV